MASGLKEEAVDHGGEPLLDSTAPSDKKECIVAASSIITEREAGERDGGVRARVSRNPVSLDEGLLRQIRVVESSAWEDRTTEELQKWTTTDLTDAAKKFTYTKFNGQRKRVSVSGSKAAVIGRILAWQAARKKGETERARKKISEHGSSMNQQWSVDETARLLLTVADGEIYASLAKIFQPATRQEIDAAKGSVVRIGWSEVAKKI